MDERLEELDRRLRRIEGEVGELRGALSRIRDEAPSASPPSSSGGEPTAAAASAPTGPARTWEDMLGRLGVQQPVAAPRATSPLPPKRPTADRRGFEELLGRYGTIGLASLTILMGVGALVSWAIRNGYIGPVTRVALGLALAAILGATGWRIRGGDSPRYGNALLALSLAVVHVVAWGAGPRLQLIGTGWVLALAAVASGALAWLAWREDDEALFTVGFGGALLAPFVTASGPGDPVMLMTYGFIVLGAGIVSVGQREWTRVPLVASMGIVGYVAAAEGMVDGSTRWAVVNAPAAFALGLGAMSIVLLEGRKRAAVAWVALSAALAVLLAVADSPAADDPQFGFAVALVLATMAAADRTLRGIRTALLGALVLPSGATAVALGTLADLTGGPGALVALAFGALAAVAAWKDVGGERGTWAFTATAHAGLAIALASDNREVAFCLATAAFGMISALATRRFAEAGIGLAGALWMSVATVVAFSELGVRVAYQYRPFLTTASLGAAAVSVAWVALSWHTARNLRPGSVLAQDLPRAAIRIAGWLVAFFWVRQELARAVSPDVSGFLLVAWYAVSGVGAIFIARARSLPILRQAGLGLALFAAVTAITQASLLAIGWRVGSYLLTGAFLLGVAWSYRVTRGQPAPEDAATA